jgi:hypothetical protein
MQRLPEMLLFAKRKLNFKEYIFHISDLLGKFGTDWIKLVPAARWPIRTFPEKVNLCRIINAPKALALAPAPQGRELLGRAANAISTAPRGPQSGWACKSGRRKSGPVRPLCARICAPL